MQENSKLFNEAHRLLQLKSYDEAVKLFRQDLKENPDNSITYNNIGVAQTFLGVVNNNKSLLESAIQHFQRAIAIAESTLGESYPSANKNLNWAKEELNKLELKNS